MNRASNSLWALNVARIFGIPIRIHLTFFLFLAWIAMDSAHGGENPVWMILFVISIFACVLLHELGHALVASKFRIRTRDIVLYPFGGVAAMMGDARPRAEFFIAIAGPAVNLFLAAAIGVLVEISMEGPLHTFSGFMTRVFWTNVLLAIFNLLPAYPMDGGRVLRAALAVAGVRNATGIATRLSQFICVLLGAWALLTGHLIMLVLSLLIFFFASQERVRDRTRSAAVGLTIGEAMLPLSAIETLPHGLTVSAALPIAVRSLQPIFPVVHNEKLLGVISRQAILELAATEPGDSYLAEHIDREFASFPPDTKVAAALDAIVPAREDAFAVMQDGKLVGLLLKEKLLEYLLVREMRERVKQWRHDEE